MLPEQPKKSHFRKVRGPGRRVSGEKFALQMGRVSQGCHGTGRFNIDGASASVFEAKNEVTLRNIWYWTSLTTRRDFFSLFSRFLTFCKSNFFLFLNFLIFVFSLPLPPSHTRNRPDNSNENLSADSRRLFKMIIKTSNKDTRFRYRCPCILTLPTVQITFL